MTLTKNSMAREIGRRTRLKNRDVQVMLEALIEVWAEELVSGGKINWRTSSYWRCRPLIEVSSVGLSPVAKYG